LRAGVEPAAVREGRRGPHLTLALAGVGIAAPICAAALTFGLPWSGGDAAGTNRATGDGLSVFVPDTPRRARAPFPAESEPSAPPAGRKPAPLPAERERTPKATCYPTAYVRRAVTLYRRPGGSARVQLAARTEWKSPRVLGVVRREGEWLAVQAPELRNGEIGWLPAAEAQMDCVRWALHADLSERRLRVSWNGRTVRRYAVAVGSPEHPTPRGRFSVTDKLRVTDSSSPYGCCVLALTGHQLRLPAGWPGGNRLAVHATNDLSSIGKPVSLGCMRTDSRRARWLIETIPQGTPIFIRS
jgi:L,D-transpeptidase catalytic domain